jgi:hypothetical protein
VLIFMYVLIFLCFLLTKSGGATSLLMGNGAHARVLGAGTVTLKFTSGKTIQLKNVQRVPTSTQSIRASCNLEAMSFSPHLTVLKSNLETRFRLRGVGCDAPGF